MQYIVELEYFDLPYIHFNDPRWKLGNGKRKSRNSHREKKITSRWFSSSFDRNRKYQWQLLFPRDNSYSFRFGVTSCYHLAFAFHDHHFMLIKRSSIAMYTRVIKVWVYIVENNSHDFFFLFFLFVLFRIIFSTNKYWKVTKK